MKFPDNIKVFGDINFRGTCAEESLEQITFFNQLRRTYPDTWGLIAIHPRNEGKKGFRQVVREKAEGMTPGAADIIIPGNPTFVCEMKRRDHTKSKWQDKQLEYLNVAQEKGAFVCIALGANAAFLAFQQYLAGRNETE